MVIRRWFVPALVASFALLASDALAATSEVNGKIVDGEGNPVKGAVVRLTNVAFPTTSYEEKTNKRGGYWIPNLLYSEQGESWKVEVEAEGQRVVEMRVESRLSDKTLFDGFEKKPAAGAELPEVTIKAFGKLQLDFVLGPAEEVVAAEVDPAQGMAAEVQAAAVGAAPQDPMALAAERVSQGDLAGSVEHLRTAVEARPDDPEIREFLAKVLYRLDRPGEAMIEASKAAELSPDRAEPQLILVDLFATQGKYDEARAALDKALAMSPDDPQVLERAAWLASEANDTDGAIEAHEALVALKPDRVESWLSLGDLYHTKNEPQKAEAAYQKVVELDPENAYKTFFNLGALIENRPNLSDADNRKVIEAFRKAIEINPEYAVAHRHLAYALMRTGDYKGARSELERYLELEPGAPDAADIKQTVSALASM